jgi:hypothetical protein
MDRLRSFQNAAQKRGFLEYHESADGTVLWLTKDLTTASRARSQRMCIDNVTKSVTVFWIVADGKVNSKTFRDVCALQEWFELQSYSVAENQSRQ